MASKKITKVFSRWVARVLLKTIFPVVECLPEKAVYSLADFLAGVGYIFLVRHRRVAIESLETAFGSEKTPRQRQEIARESFSLMAKSALEMLFFLNHLDLVTERVTIKGEEHLKAALAEGKGAVIASAHFGNFPLLISRFASGGYKTNAIIRHMRDEQTDAFLSKKREPFGFTTIFSTPRQECVRKSLQALRNNELLFVLMDQNFGTGGVFVDFFGRKAATATGPVIFALRTKAPIVPVFIVRNRDNSSTVFIEPALHVQGSTADDAVIANTVQAVTTIIEKYIRRYPQEWGWVHRRWKSRPSREEAV